MTDNYYDRILTEIRDAIEHQEWKKARDLLEEELKMPYVPADVLTQLEQLKRETDSALTTEKKPQLLDDDELSRCLRGSQEEKYMAVDSLSRSNIRNHLDVIQQYLLDEKADRMLVSMLVEQCMLQQVDSPLIYVSHGKKLTVVPKHLYAPLDDEILHKSWRKLSELLESTNPSFLKQCQQVLVQYGYLNYPDPLDEDWENLTYSVICYVFKAYGDEAGWKRFAERINVDIDKILEISI